MDTDKVNVTIEAPPPVTPETKHIQMVNFGSKSSSKNKSVAVVLVLLILGLLALLVYLFYQNMQLKQQVELIELDEPTVATCEYNNQTYEAGEGFTASDGCNSCSCGETGEVACTLMACENIEEDGSSNASGENRYTVGNYSFVIPQDFQIEEEYLEEANIGYVKVSDNRITFELVVNNGGRGVQCYELESENLVNVDKKSRELLKYRGIDNSEHCTDPEQNSKYVYWLVLERFTPPKEGIKDIIWYSFDTDEVSKTEADRVLDHILSTFEFTE